MCVVVNIKTDKCDVYIGRGSPLGNPFIIGVDGNRDDVVEKYRIYLYKLIKDKEITKEYLISLDNKRLGCFCKPKRCHGDVVVKAVSWAKASLQT